MPITPQSIMNLRTMTGGRLLSKIKEEAEYQQLLERRGTEEYGEARDEFLNKRREMMMVEQARLWRERTKGRPSQMDPETFAFAAERRMLRANPSFQHFETYMNYPGATDPRAGNTPDPTLDPANDRRKQPTYADMYAETQRRRLGGGGTGSPSTGSSYWQTKERR